MADDTTGMIGRVLETHQDRDAIHVAVVSVVAGEKLAPGDHVGLIDKATMSVGESATELIGVIDPYLKKAVKKGEICWLFMYPNSITALKHEWKHPAFGEKADSSHMISDKYIKDYGLRLGLSRQEMLQRAAGYLDSGDGGELEDEFWDHYEIVTGRKVPAWERETNYECKGCD